MKTNIAIIVVSLFLAACGHGGSVGIDAEKSKSESTKIDSTMSRDKSMTVSSSGGKKEAMPALLLLGDATSSYIAPVFPKGSGVILSQFANYIYDSDKRRLDVTLNGLPMPKKMSEQDRAIALLSASLSPQLGWPHSFFPTSASVGYYIIAVSTTVTFANNIYAKAADKVSQNDLANQGQAKDRAIEYVLSLPNEELESIFSESLQFARQLQRSAKPDLVSKLGNVGFVADGETIFGDQAGWHITKAGSAVFGGEVINGKTITLSMDNTLDHTMAKRKVNSEATEVSDGQSTKTSAGLK